MPTSRMWVGACCSVGHFLWQAYGGWGVWFPPPVWNLRTVIGYLFVSPQVFLLSCLNTQTVKRNAYVTKQNVHVFIFGNGSVEWTNSLKSSLMFVYTCNIVCSVLFEGTNSLKSSLWCLWIHVTLYVLFCICVWVNFVDMTWEGVSISERVWKFAYGRIWSSCGYPVWLTGH